MAIDGLLGYVPYYSSDGAEVMRLPVISVSGTYPTIDWKHSNASSKLTGVVFKHDEPSIYSLVSKLGTLHLVGPTGFSFRPNPNESNRMYAMDINTDINDGRYWVIIYRANIGKYEPGYYASLTDVLFVMNSTAQQYAFTLELFDNPEPPSIATLDPTSLLMGYRVGQMIRGMR
jgi:hypothetical protein